MEECTTLDELIAALEKKRAEFGGGTRVLLKDEVELFTPSVREDRVGKSTPYKTVSRGGVPVVVLSSY